MPVLSICIPTYNRADYLFETLLSITSNNIFKNTNDVEIVISNNASTDNTDEICTEFKNKFPDKINYIKLEEPIFSDANIFGVLNYAKGKYCKINNDTCVYKIESLEKIINYLKENDDDFIFFLNQKSEPSSIKKVKTYAEFLNETSYQLTWVGGMCFKKTLYDSIDNPIRYKEKRLAQIDIYGKIFNSNHAVTVWREELFKIISPAKKGGAYNISEVFGKNYFDILSEYLNATNGTTKEVIEKEKEKIFDFINFFYFDTDNIFAFEKDGYLKNMLKYYKMKPYFYKKYLSLRLKKILKFIMKVEKDENKTRVKLFNSIKLSFKKHKNKRKEQKRKSKQELYSIKKYSDFIFNSSYDMKNKKHFVPDIDETFERKEDDVKLIAFYLPQFHSIPLNDKNFGKNFTDWNNAVSAIPQFEGHYQPHLPLEGFYNLSNKEVMENQSKLAQKYGIYGFCYHYYWFSGDRLLEKPIFDMLNNKNVTIPFCFCWANENWSKMWDGGNRELLKAQTTNKDDGEKFFFDMLDFFKDERYIKIDNKPLLVIYRPDLFKKDDFIYFQSTLRQKAKENGFDGLYIISSNFKFTENPDEWCLDGVVEFPPHGMIDNGLKVVLDNSRYINPNFKGEIYDMEDYINNEKYFKNVPYNLFKAVFPSWDNSARKAYSGASVFDKMASSLYKKWLSDCIKYTKTTKSKSEQFVFINAWNEWAEGAHLEPDMKYGYMYLKNTKEAIEEER